MLLDVHCHLTDPYFSESLDAIIKESIENNLGVIISAGLNMKDNRKVLEISKKYEIVKAALGIYPIDALDMDYEMIENEIRFIEQNKKKIIAISEVGLDYHFSKESKKQKEVFQKFIELSEKINKPLIIHSRKAESDVIDMLESSNIKIAIFHSFGGNKNLIKRIIDNKWSFSIPPLIVRSSNYQTLVKIAPLQCLLTETDAPYQSPLKNQKNKPYLVTESIRKISEIKNLDQMETENIIFMNFQNIFMKWKTI